MLLEVPDWHQILGQRGPDMWPHSPSGLEKVVSLPLQGHGIPITSSSEPASAHPRD